MSWLGDTFTGIDGDPPDPLFWTPDPVYDDFLTIQGNKLQGYGSGAVDINDFRNANSVFTADFDIQIDVENPSGGNPSSSMHYAGLTVYQGGTYSGLHLARGSSGNRFVASGSNPTWANISRSITTTKVRLVRTGTTLKGYYWSGSQWEWNGSTAGFTFNETYSGDVNFRIYYKYEGSGSSSWNIDFDNFVINSGAIDPDLEIEDFSMDLAAYYQKYESMQMILEALSQKNESFQMLLQAVKNIFKDFSMILEVTDGTILNDFAMMLEAADGTVFSDFAMLLEAVETAPTFRSVSAHRVSSVTHEVS